MLIFLLSLILIITPANAGMMFPFSFWKSASAGTNYYGTAALGDVTYSTNTNLTSTTDSDMVVMNYHNLTINSGVTVTTSARCKGLLIYATGNVTINGTLTMSARGAAADPVAAGVSASGLIFRRFTTGGTSSNSGTNLLNGAGTAAVSAENNQPVLVSNGTLFTIARAGAAGAASISGATTLGGNGSNGTAGQSGGGGGGGGNNTTTFAGAGSAGTCFSGGTGGGGVFQDNYTSSVDGQANGGSGGNASQSGGVWGASGGSGNPGGAAVGGSGSAGQAGNNGTGGLLVIIAKGTVTVGATGVISADGVQGGGNGSGGTGREPGGGGTGGGNILILHAGTYTNSGSVHATGGAGGVCLGGCPTMNGGAGGNGSVQEATIL